MLNGEPIIFYHGTKNKFKTFDDSFIGTSTDAGWLGKCFYFYDNYNGNLRGKTVVFNSNQIYSLD